MPYTIALITVLLPLISVHATLTIGIVVGNLDPCIPYWSSCHSISATGRQYPEFFVFKALLIPTAVFMMAYWLLLDRWIKQLSRDNTSPTIVTGMGLIASVALIVYTVTLGAEGESYGLARRIGVVFYFAFTSFGHLILLRHLDKIDTASLDIIPQQNRLTISCLVLIGTAVASAFAGLLWEEGWDNWENAYEWWFSLLMISMLYQVAVMWKKTGYRINLHLEQS
ncbi:MAG: hypothetical protein AAGJ37_03800 [Pseudomonadota bacterium]